MSSVREVIAEIGMTSGFSPHESLVYDMLQKEASEFKSKLVAMYKEHINLINQLPEIVEEQIEETVDEEPVVEEAVVEEPAEEFVVIEDAEEIETVEEIEEVVEEIEEDFEVIEEPVEEIEEIEEVEETVEEEPAVEEPVVKKAFKLDLSKIDFADDIDDTVETVEEACFCTAGSGDPAHHRLLQHLLHFP